MGFADLGKCAEVMMLLHQLLKTLLFKRADAPDEDFG